jgi:thioredoxin-like negative regulator of GroEL
MTQKYIRLGASWCNPCRQLEQQLAGLPNLPQPEYVDIDTERGKQLREQYGVRTVPSMINLETGQVISSAPNIIRELSNA